MQKLINSDPSKRLSVREFLQSEYFNDISLKAISYLESLAEKDLNSKSQFFKGIFNALSQFSQKMIEKEVEYLIYVFVFIFLV